MAETTRERQGELVRAVFAVLLDQPEGMAAADVLADVERRVPPTPFENETYPKSPTVRRYPKIVRFATIGPVKAGWLVKDSGRWSITDEGRKAYESFTDPAELMIESSRLYRVWKRQQPIDEAGEGDDEEAGGESAIALEEAEESAASAIRKYLAAMPPYEFQNLVAALLRAMDYHVLWVAPPGPDQGIDVIASSDPLGTGTPRIKVQVKQQPDTRIAVDGLRAFMAVLGDQDVGIFISAGGFTREAQREARAQERRTLTLIDLDQLVRLWIEHYENVRDTDRLRLPLRPVFFLAPQE
ncbi:MAG: restriction endonuclease [Gemmatimonadaceae bacterium]